MTRFRMTSVFATNSCLVTVAIRSMRCAERRSGTGVGYLWWTLRPEERIPTTVYSRRKPERSTRLDTAVQPSTTAVVTSYWNSSIPARSANSSACDG